MGFCSIPDVAECFPSFQRNSPGSVSDARIQAWIDQAAARIKAALFHKGIDLNLPTLPNGQPLSSDQQNWLSSLNADYAVGELGRALEGSVTLQPGEISPVAGRRKNFESTLADIGKGRYDAYFGIGSSIAQSIGGAETDQSTPDERGENRAFGRNQRY